MRWTVSSRESLASKYLVSKLTSEGLATSRYKSGSISLFCRGFSGRGKNILHCHTLTFNITNFKRFFLTGFHGSNFRIGPQCLQPNEPSAKLVEGWTNLCFELEFATASELKNAFYPRSWKPVKSGITESVTTAFLSETCFIWNAVNLLKSNDFKAFSSFAISYKQFKICARSVWHTIIWILIGF